MVKQVTNNLPRTSHPPASPRCTVRSHCKDSVLDFCSFAQVCIPSSDHQCTRVYKAHSDKIPERSKDEMINQELGTVSKERYCDRVYSHVYSVVPGLRETHAVALLTCMSHKTAGILGKLQQALSAWRNRTGGRGLNGELPLTAGEGGRAEVPSRSGRWN